MSSEMSKKALARVLVIDDDPYFTAMCLDHLSGLGYRARAVHDIQETLTVLAELDDIAVVLLDPYLSEKTDGKDICRRIHEQRPKLPIILTTDAHAVSDLQDLIAEGCSGFVSKKSFSPDVLSFEIRRALEAARLQKEHDHAQRAYVKKAGTMMAVFATVPQGIILTDDRGIITHVNPACENIFGYLVGELVGRNVSLLIPTGQVDDHAAHVSAFEQGSFSTFIHRTRVEQVRRKSGEIFPIELRVVETTIDGKPGFLASCQDITARTRTEHELENKIEALQEILHKKGKAAGSVERVRRSVLGRTSIALLVMGLGLAAATILPLRHDLQLKNEAEVHFIVDARVTAINQFFSKIKTVAEQVATRTEARRQLIRFNKGEIDNAGLVANSQHILQDALESSEDLVSITRLDREGKLVLAVGVPVSKPLLARLDHQHESMHIHDPILVEDGQYIAVTTHIIDQEQGFVGKDLSLFRTDDLRTIVEDDVGLARTGEIALVHQHDGEFASIFSTQDQSGLEIFTPVLADFQAGAFRADQTRHDACPGCVVAIRDLSEHDWYLVFNMRVDEFNSLIDTTVGRIVLIVLAIITLGMAGVYVLTHPLLRSLSSELQERIRAEAISQRNATMYRSLFEGAGDGIFLVDPKDQKFIEVNEIACRRLGYTRDELLRMGPVDIADPKQGVDPIVIIQALQESGSHTFEHVHRCKDGTAMPVEITASLVQWDERRVVQSVVRDVTARKAAEDRLRRSEAQLSMSQAISHLGSWEWTIDDDILVWSDEMYRVFGYEPGEVIPTYKGLFCNAVPFDDLIRIEEALDASMETGALYHIEHRIIRPNGALRWVEERAQLETDSEGQPYRFHGTGMDITERKLADKAVRDSEAMLREVVNLAQVVIAVKDEDGRYLFANAYMADLYGMSPEELEGKRQADLHPVPGQLADFRAADRQALYEGATVVIHEETFTDIRGQNHILTTTKMGLHWKSIPATLVVALDITDRVEAERKQRVAEVMAHAAEEASHLQNAFLSAMSHELRTPLTTILGFPPILEMTISGEIAKIKEGRMPDAKKLAEVLGLILRIEERGERLLALINDILDVAKAEAGELRLQPEALVAEPIIRSELDGLQTQAAAKGLQLDINVEPGLVVQADPHRLRQILANLVGNALKFTDHGAVTLTARRDGRFGVFTVHDTGVGIADDDLDVVFDKFHQVGDHTRQLVGTGLGLAICRELVQRHGGTIHAESTLGQGSEFIFQIPIAQQEGE